MSVNTRTEYALRALLEMQGYERDPVSAQKICDRQQLPKKYVEHLLSALKSAGLINSSAGSKGGYALSRPADAISLLDVMQAVEDSSLQMDCVMNKGEHCLGDGCRLSEFFSELSDQQKELFSSHNLKSIAAKYYHTGGKHEKR